MASENIGQRLLPLIQQDIAGRGLANKPQNLFNALPDDLSRAIQDLAKLTAPRVAIITGFFIPDAVTPTAETDGPLGAIFLARTLSDLGASCIIGIEAEFAPAVRAGLKTANLDRRVTVCELPMSGGLSYDENGNLVGPLYEMLNFPQVAIFIERVGWACTWDNLFDVDQIEFIRELGRRTGDHRFTMRGIDINDRLAPTDLIANLDGCHLTIGIGDGGNEIGMGKLEWSLIRDNIPNGGKIACCTSTKHLIVAGISNWGGYALGVGFGMAKGRIHPEWFDIEM